MFSITEPTGKGRKKRLRMIPQMLPRNLTKLLRNLTKLLQKIPYQASCTRILIKRKGSGRKRKLLVNKFTATDHRILLLNLPGWPTWGHLDFWGHLSGWISQEKLSKLKQGFIIKKSIILTLNSLNRVNSISKYFHILDWVNYNTLHGLQASLVSAIHHGFIFIKMSYDLLLKLDFPRISEVCWPCALLALCCWFTGIIFFEIKLFSTTSWWIFCF